jgi:hypothetical protein
MQKHYEDVIVHSANGSVEHVSVNIQVCAKTRDV